MAYQQIKRLLPKDSYHEYKADLRLVLLQPDGSERSVIEFKSGENPDSLRGFAVHFFVLDEAARIPLESYDSVMTTLTQTQGKGLIISTPHGRGWFYDEYQRGQKFWDNGEPKYPNPEDDPFPEYFSIRMPTWSNPTVKPEAIRQFKKNKPEDVFRQEIAAQFLLESAGVFKKIKQCIRGSLQQPVRGKHYVMGVDLARLRDYSVLTVLDQADNHVVYHERFNQIAWEVQYQRIIETAKRYNNAVTVMDSTGLGDPVVGTIQSAGVRVVPYKITGSAAKQKLIDKLRVNIEQQRISFPYIPVLKDELETFEYELTASGAVQFSAPSGKHDDTVISLALANWASDQEPFVYRHKNVRGI
jgi:hypothetical protein